MGSPTGIWTAVSGGMAQSERLDVISNNIANANTVGFKKDEATFKEYLTTYERTPDPAIDIPRTAFKDSDFYHFDGREHAMVNVDQIKTDHEQGQLRPTRNPLDLGVEGKAFFAVQTPTGIRFTRAGDFKINGEGVLVTTDGYPVLTYSGEAEAQAEAARSGEEALAEQPAAPTTPAAAGGGDRAPASLNPFTAVAKPGQEALLKPLSLADAAAGNQKITINQYGDVYSGGQRIGILATAEFANPSLLKKDNLTLFSNVNPENVPRIAKESKIHQGFLELSNVNSVSELVDLIKANRLFESNMRAIKAYNEMATKEANEVGKL